MLIVKKFGGSSVADKERIFNVAKRCIEDYEAGNDVVVVLSAMGKTTDRLIEMARDINPKASKREMDMLLATGEQTSVALMSMAMQSLGVSAVSLNAFQVVMHTTSAYSNAKFKRIDTERIFNELEQRRIVIITGFQGVNKYDDIIAISINKDIEKRVSDMMVSLNYIVILVIGCAGALAFIVLFNLGNINLTERVREIATIEVLGFYPREMGSYVFRENFILVLIGIVAGLPTGYVLHKFIMSRIVVDAVSFNEIIEPASYVFTVLTVIGFSVIVDLILRRKMRRINMAEALKSIE